jgi:hypothetical protein
LKFNLKNASFDENLSLARLKKKLVAKLAKKKKDILRRRQRYNNQSTAIPIAIPSWSLDLLHETKQHCNLDAYLNHLNDEELTAKLSAICVNPNPSDRDHWLITANVLHREDHIKIWSGHITDDDYDDLSGDVIGHGMNRYRVERELSSAVNLSDDDSIIEGANEDEVDQYETTRRNIIKQMQEEEDLANRARREQELSQQSNSNLFI